MSWEKRGSKTYYYRKVRQGGRVTSRYVGAGPAVEQLVERRQQRHQAEQQRRHTLAILDTSFTQLQTLIQALRCATLLLTGHYTHKGQWRKRRARPP